MSVDGSGAGPATLGQEAADPATLAPVSIDERVSAGLSTQPAPVRQPGLGVTGWARWAWRLLTSMRTALVLLFLLAVAAVPGSLLPQRPVDPGKVDAYAAQHTVLFPVYDALSLFDVFASPWFSAIYLLLFISLVGCVLPRSRQHWRAMRARPPAAPRTLSRLPQHRSVVTDAPPAQVLAAARDVLRRRRYRVDAGASAVAAERGHLRETGNLVFHLSLIVVLVGVAIGHLFGFRGNVIVVEGRSFVNVDGGYDTLEAGPRFDKAGLAPFSVHLDRFTVTYQERGAQAGAPRTFRADVTYRSRPGAAERHAVVSSNKPLVVDGTKVFLTGNGYAPRFTVRDHKGRIVSRGATPFLPQDSMMTSQGVLKLPDAPVDSGARTGLAFQGLMLPTAIDVGNGVASSAFPDTLNPEALLAVFTGDMGIDNGSPQSVYALDSRKMTQLTKADGSKLRLTLRLHQTAALPGGNGSITFDGVKRFVNFKVARDPGTRPAAVGAAFALLGLLASLFVRRRRLWVRALPGDDGRTVVEVGALSRTYEEGLSAHIDEVTAEITAALSAKE